MMGNLLTVNVALQGWSFREDHRELSGFVWLSGLDIAQSNELDKKPKDGQESYRCRMNNLTKPEAAQIALAAMVFATIPIEQITHNNWIEYLKDGE